MGCVTFSGSGLVTCYVKAGASWAEPSRTVCLSLRITALKYIQNFSLLSVWNLEPSGEVSVLAPVKAKMRRDKRKNSCVIKQKVKQVDLEKQANLNREAVTWPLPLRL